MVLLLKGFKKVWFKRAKRAPFALLTGHEARDEWSAMVLN